MNAEQMPKIRMRMMHEEEDFLCESSWDTEESPSKTTSCSTRSLGEGHNLYIFVHYIKPSCDTPALPRVRVCGCIDVSQVGSV